MALQQPVTPPDNQGEDEEQQQLKMAMLAAQMGQGGAQTATQTPAGPGAPIDMSSLDQPPSLPPTPAPNVHLAHADYASQPAAADVTRAQGNLDSFQHTPLWKKALVPALIGAGSALGAHTWGGRQLQENGQQDIQNYIGTRRGQQDTLIKQVEFAKQQQQAQYEADQRNRQQDIMMVGNNQTKALTAQLLANSRRDVAGITGQSRENVADTGAQSRENVAGQNVAGREQVAAGQNQTRLHVAGINAKAALDRFLAGQDRTDQRQANSFGHTDTKPTADEDRRADLVEAMMGYADAVSDIAKRRPELFGPSAGRFTQLRNLVGTSDPDVAALKMYREQLGITQMGAHSLRSAQAIAPIADAMVNSFNNDAGVVAETMNRAKKGVQPLLSPQRPVVNGVGPRTPLASRVQGNTPAPPRPPSVPPGYVYGPSKQFPGRNSWQPPAQQ